MAKFGGNLGKSEKTVEETVEEYVSIEDGAQLLFEGSFINYAEKDIPDWNEQPQDIKDVWIRKAAIETLSDQPKLYQSVCLNVYMSGDGLSEIDWFAVLSPTDTDKYVITKMDVKLMIGTQENSTR